MTANASEQATAFIGKFLDRELLVWQLNYSERDADRVKDAIQAFTREFYAFPATVLISRPRHPDGRWFEEAQDYLLATIRRPLFKIETYLDQGRPHFAAYTGSSDLGSSTYYQVLVCREVRGELRICSVYHPDGEGGLDHFEGETFAFRTAALVRVDRFLPPTDVADLLNYRAVTPTP